MLKFPSDMPPNIPFIADQRLWWLKVKHYSQARQCLTPASFASAREVRKEDADRIARHAMPPQCEWIEVSNRAAFLANPREYLHDLNAVQARDARLICLVIDAGIGKSTCMLQTQLLRGGGFDPGHLTIGVQFDHCPTDANEYLREGWLVNRLCEVLPDCDPTVAQQLLQRKIRTGEFTLLVDGLDQITLKVDPARIASALASFLSDICPKAQCVLAGRPPAVEEFWDNLFAKSGPWVFAQIDQFTPEQRRTYLGPKREQLLERLDADIVAVPRMLETLRRIEPDPDGNFPEIRTGSDLYWRSFSESLRKDIENRDIDLDFDNALFLFSLLGFESLKEGYLNGISDKETANKFLKGIAKRRKVQIEDQFALDGNVRIGKELKKLGTLSSVLLHSVLETGSSLERIIFRDPTIRDFMAAVWVAKFATSDDAQWLKENQFVQTGSTSLERDKSTFKGAMYYIWRFATEMPRVAFDPDVWAKSMSSMFESGENRSSEMIWRCWGEMLIQAGYADAGCFWEMDFQPFTLRAQCEAREFVLNEQGDCRFKSIKDLCRRVHQEPNPAKQNILKFLTEYPAMLGGLYGEDAKRIAKEFDTGFVEITDKIEEIRDQGGKLVDVKFVPSTNRNVGLLICVGEEGKEKPIVVDQPFQLAKHQITNELFALFFPGSRTRREDDPETRPRCAAVNLNWFDAFTASLFFGGRLPSEDEWEYACRARPGVDLKAWDWCFGDDESRLREYGIYDKGYENDAEAVGTLKPWGGLYDMHGNVWEWCSSWYSGDRADGVSPSYVGASRCLRGGSCGNSAAGCRCANRIGDQPVDANHYSGFRVARVFC